MCDKNQFKCNDKDKIVGIYLFNENDFVIDKKTGKFRLKRKYGKFKREYYYIDKTK